MQANINEAWAVNVLRTEINSAYGQISTTNNPANSTMYRYNDVKNYLSLTYDEKDTKVVTFYNDRDLYGQSRKLNRTNFTDNASNFFTQKYGIDMQHTWKLNHAKDYLIGGALISRDTYEGKSLANSAIDATRNNFAVYGSYNHKFNDQWSTTVGLRLQHVDDPIKDQNVIIPQWQSLYKINDHSSFYSNIGRAFTMPNLSDAFNKNSSSGQYRAVSGPNLKPEDGWNYELGYKFIANKNEWKVALYHMEFKNFFEWKTDPTAPLNSVRVNGGKFRNTGIEIDYKHHFNERLSASLGMSYSNPKNKSLGATEWTQTYPKFQLNSNVKYTMEKWDASLTLNYLTKRLKNRDGGLNPDLINLNLQGGYHFNEHHSLYVMFNNILNRHNVISNGDWEYWDLPFNYRVQYEYKF